jgi:diamine N-acetyltransferase
MIILSRVSVADAAMLTKISREIYKEHYLHLWHPGGAEWYMNSYAYAINTIEKDLEDPFIEYYFVTKKSEILGYLKLIVNATLFNEPLKRALEVERIYLYNSATGKGYGKDIMEFAKQRAISLQKEIIFLKAMDTSLKAIAFYQKSGYKVCDILQLPLPTFILMKEEFRGMVVLRKKL